MKNSFANYPPVHKVLEYRNRTMMELLKKNYTQDLEQLDRKDTLDPANKKVLEQLQM